MTIRYQTIRTDDTTLRERMRAIAQERRRFGYRRALAQRVEVAEGEVRIMGSKSRLLQTLWREAA